MSLGAKHKPIPKKIRMEIYQKYGGRCAYCGCTLEYKDMQVDHIIPKWREEWDKEATDTVENYNPACRACNFYKSAFNLEDFRENVESLMERVNGVFIYKLAKKYGFVKEVPVEMPIKFYFEKCTEHKN